MVACHVLLHVDKIVPSCKTLPPGRTSREKMHPGKPVPWILWGLNQGRQLNMFRKRSHCLQWLPASEREPLQLGRKQITSAFLEHTHQTREQMFYSSASFFLQQDGFFLSFHKAYSTAAGEVAHTAQPRPPLCAWSLGLSDWQERSVLFLLQSLPHHSTNRLHERTPAETGKHSPPGPFSQDTGFRTGTSH